MKDFKKLLRWLEKGGFDADRTRPHYVVTHADAPGDHVIIPKSSYGGSSYTAAVSQLRNVFRDVDTVDWDKVPGAARPPARKTSLKNIAGIGSVERALAGARGPKGELMFAGRIERVVGDDGIVLRVGNPFFVVGSGDPMRSREHIDLRFSDGEWSISDETANELLTIGIDLSCSEWYEVRESFAAFARCQRTEMIQEHRARRSWNRILGDDYIGRATGRGLPDVDLVVR